jgi:hypothetical protein
MTTRTQVETGLRALYQEQAQESGSAPRWCWRCGSSAQVGRKCRYCGEYLSRREARLIISPEVAG